MGDTLHWTHWETNVKPLIYLPYRPLANESILAPQYSLKRKRSCTPARQSARLQERKGLHQQPEVQDHAFQLPSPTSITPDKEVHPKALGVQSQSLTQAKASAGAGQAIQFNSEE